VLLTDEMANQDREQLYFLMHISGVYDVRHSFILNIGT
jgi:hypothetical protein